MLAESIRVMRSSKYSEKEELKCFSLRRIPPNKMATLNTLIEPLWTRQKQCGMTLACLTNGGSSLLNTLYTSTTVLQWSAFIGALHFRGCTKRFQTFRI